MIETKPGKTISRPANCPCSPPSSSSKRCNRGYTTIYEGCQCTDPIENDGNNEVDAAFCGAAHEPEDMGAFTGWILLFGFSALFAILAFLV